LNPDEIFEAGDANLAPNSFPELAYSITGPSDKIQKFYSSRWWSLSPFESIQFAPDYQPTFPAAPNDPLLLHYAMAQKQIPQDTALMLINSPLSNFGVAPVLLGFKDAFGVSGAALFTPFDSKEEIAAKTQILPPVIKSIRENPILSDFSNQGNESPIVLAVFGIARRFRRDEIFQFFRDYFGKTPQFDNHWLKLFLSQGSLVKNNLTFFLSEFPDRLSVQQILLGEEAPLQSLSVIHSLDNEILLPKLNRFAKSSVEEGKLAAEKLKQFGQTFSPPQNPGGRVPPPEFPGLLRIVSRAVSTSDKVKTLIILNVESDIQEEIYAVTFTIGNRDFFESDALVILPRMEKNAALVKFELKPRKIAACKLTLVCTFTKADGSCGVCTLTGDPALQVQPVELLSGSNLDFKTAWGNGQETRVTLNLKFPKFLEHITATAFGMHCEREENVCRSVVVTPSDEVIALKAIAIGGNTSVQVMAPSIDLLLIIDDFLRQATQGK
jgi:hypothetical protein